MKRFVFVTILLFSPMFEGTLISQTTHDISVSNFSFTPAHLTIKTGDEVRWTNNGGLHSVVADDNSFTSGDPSSAAWIYEHTFNSAGSNPYYCSVHGGPGGAGMSGVITVEGATDVNDNPITIKEHKLDQNYPNPFNPTTVIHYELPASEKVILKIYDVLGNEVETLINSQKTAGYYNFDFNGINLPSGIYFYQIKAGNFIQTKKMVLLK